MTAHRHNKTKLLYIFSLQLLLSNAVLSMLVSHMSPQHISSLALVPAHVALELWFRVAFQLHVPQHVELLLVRTAASRTVVLVCENVIAV